MTVIFHLQKSYLDSIKELGYDYTVGSDTIKVELPTIEYQQNHAISNPNEQVCDHYFIDYDYVNSIEII